MFNLRSAIIGAIGFSALVFAAPAQAVTVQVDANGAAVALSSGNVYVQATGDGSFVAGSGAFVDVYSFTYNPAPELTNIASTTNLILSTNYGINDFLFSWVGPGGSGVNQSGPGLFSNTALQLTTAGTYFFTLTGTPRSQGGQYTFSMLLEEPSTVPLPPALALFGTGLVGLGLLARRRRSLATAA